MTFRTRPFLHLLPGLLAAGWLAGCIEGDFFGEGLGDPIESPEGIWSGPGNFVGGGNLVGLIQDGRFMIVQQVNNNPVRFYAGDYDPADDGPWAARLTRYTGGVADRSLETTLSASVTLNIRVGNEREILPLAPVDDLTDRAASAEMVADIWEAVGPQSRNLVIAIDSNGVLAGTDAVGCQYNAVVTVIDPQQNLYRVDELTLTEAFAGNCDRDDGEGATVSYAGEDYVGLAAFFDNNLETRNLMWLIAANGERAILRQFGRESALSGGQPGQDDEEPGNDGIPPGAGTPPTDD